MCLLSEMKALNPEQNTNYEFLGCEQAEQIDTDASLQESESRNGQENESVNISGTL